MTGPSGVLALVLAETAAGATAVLFLTPLWSEVRPGFFLLAGGVVLALSGLAGWAGAVSYGPDQAAAGRLAVGAAAAMAALTALWLAALLARIRGLSRAVGLGTVPVAAAMLFAFSRLSDEGVVVSFFQLLAGALFTGTVTVGLLLGHWYLTDRKLPRRPIDRASLLLIGAVVVEVVAVAAGGFGGNVPGTEATRSLNPILTIAGSATWIALGMVVTTGLIAVFIRLALRGPRPTAVQGATGFFYLAMLTSFVGEVAAKIRFLP